MLDALVEDQNLVLSTISGDSQLPVTPASGDLTFFSQPHRHMHTCGRHRQTYRQADTLIYTHAGIKNKMLKKKNLIEDGRYNSPRIFRHVI